MHNTHFVVLYFKIPMNNLYLNLKKLFVLQEEGKVDVLANEAGDRITPAVVSITDEETVCFFLLDNNINIVKIFV